jgi:NH3-dependent NAD+ synthetase
MPGMTDEFILQMPYSKIDLILYGLENNISEKEIINEGLTEKEIDYIKTLHMLSKHQREMPPYPRLI